MSDLRYPVGDYRKPAVITAADREKWISDVENLPSALQKAVDGLNDRQLDTPYRPGGWTVRQVVHHLADSHVNSYTRFKLALTEDNPLIRAYDEKGWAELPEARTGPLSITLPLIAALHHRWALVLRTMTDSDFKRPLQHPESGDWTVEELLSQYSWHCLHHVAHIAELRRRESW